MSEESGRAPAPSPAGPAGNRRLKIVAGVIIALLVLLGGGGLYVYHDDIHKPMRAGQAALNLTIPAGTSVSGVADILQKNGLIDNPLIFQVYVRYHGLNSSLEAGNYQVPPGTDMVDLVALLQHAKGYEVSVTIPEGLTTRQTGLLLNHKGMKFSADAFVAAAASSGFTQDFLADRPAGANLEGFLFPDTYHFAQTAKPGDVIQAELTRFGLVVTPAVRAKAAAIKMSFYQALTVASIVEREGKFDADRAQIASVFYNRLAAGMPLQSDVTVAYAKGLPSQPITEADKSINSPYNTYLHTGLPPGPISNPGLASITAALEPAQTDFLYFLTDKDGHAHFSKTLAEHQQQIVQYGVQ
jgi:UPF0755 protein